jgi:osmotically-inducible protein OsmY
LQNQATMPDDDDTPRSPEKFGQGWSGGRGLGPAPGSTTYEGAAPPGMSRDDERVYEAVLEALTREPGIDASGIQLQVRDGAVTLSGRVPDAAAKARAGDLAERASGARDVTNQLAVG